MNKNRKLMNKLLKAGVGILLAVMLVISGGFPDYVSAETPPTISVMIDGVQQQYTHDPIKKNNYVLVPMRAIFKSMGAEILWDSERSTVHAYKWYPDGSTVIVLPIGKETAYINGRAIELSVKAEVIDGSTMVPLRFVGEALGAKVNWGNNTVSIESGKGQRPAAQWSGVGGIVNSIIMAESNQQEADLVARLEQGFIALEEKKQDTNEDYNLYRDVLVPLFAIDRKIDYVGWSDKEGLNRVLNGYLPLLDQPITIPKKYQYAMSFALSEARNIELAKQQIKRVLEKSKSTKPGLVPSNFNVWYGVHGYNNQNQEEYDIVMEIIRHAINSFDDSQLFSRTNYSEYYEKYLAGDRATNYDSSSLDFRGLSIAENLFGTLLKAGQSVDQIKKFYKAADIAIELTSGLPGSNNHGKTIWYEYNGVKKTVQKSGIDYEISLSAYDALVRRLEGRESVTQVHSAVFDALGYNTMVIDRTLYVDLDGQWWSVFGMSWYNADVKEIVKKNRPSTQPTFGPKY